MTGADAEVIKRHGIHYTPTHLAEFLAERGVAHLTPNGIIRVMDPACGDGELLLAAASAISSRFPDAQVDLVGYDLSQAAIDAAHNRLSAEHYSFSLICKDFLGAYAGLQPESFDLVISNPPYVRTQQLGAALSRDLAARFGLTGRLDITHAFVAAVALLLKQSGVLSLLCSNRFLTTKAGSNMRYLFSTALKPIELYDLGDTKLFKAAVLPAVIVAQRSALVDETICPFISAYELGQQEITALNPQATLFEGLLAGVDNVVMQGNRFIQISAGVLQKDDTGKAPWRMSHKDVDGWLSGIEQSTFTHFGDVAKIRVGIKTTADKVFISQKWDENPNCPESELLMRLVTHEDVNPWVMRQSSETKVLYPYNKQAAKRELLNLSDFPKASKYFLEHEQSLRKRKYVTDAGREWYEIWVPQSPSMWSSPKIIFPDISVEPRFALDISGAVVNGDCYWMSLRDIGDENLLYLMLAVANSNLGMRYYDAVCGNKLYSGRRRWMTQYVEKLPLPNPNSVESQELIRFSKEISSNNAPPDRDALRKLDVLVEKAFYSNHD